jgi:hypothetical protein
LTWALPLTVWLSSETELAVRSTVEGKLARI